MEAQKDRNKKQNERDVHMRSIRVGTASDSSVLSRANHRVQRGRQLRPRSHLLLQSFRLPADCSCQWNPGQQAIQGNRSAATAATATTQQSPTAP